ncbi:MAG TPA: hypothetical protein PLJ48_05495, partial [Dermatophilaceae bacterium]|nr:hypothetical protein [Dermatophilaceae bacterium]
VAVAVGVVVAVLDPLVAVVVTPGPAAEVVQPATAALAAIRAASVAAYRRLVWRTPAWVPSIVSPTMPGAS